MASRIFCSATIYTAAALAAAGFPVLAETAATSPGSSSSQSAAASSAGTRYSETIGITTPHKRIVGTTHGTAAQGSAADDDRILGKVVDALVRDPGMQGADIEVKVDSGNVTLDGRTKNAGQADHARQVAASAAGEGQVTSRLSTSG